MSESTGALTVSRQREIRVQDSVVGGCVDGQNSFAVFWVFAFVPNVDFAYEINVGLELGTSLRSDKKSLPKIVSAVVIFRAWRPLL
jgi:hypothetical protein